MIPWLSLRQRFIAWLLWQFERFDSMETARVAVEHPEVLRCSSLLRDYFYVKQSKVVE